MLNHVIHHVVGDVDTRPLGAGTGPRWQCHRAGVETIALSGVYPAHYPRRTGGPTRGRAVPANPGAAGWHGNICLHPGLRGTLCEVA